MAVLNFCLQLTLFQGQVNDFIFTYPGLIFLWNLQKVNSSTRQCIIFLLLLIQCSSPTMLVLSKLFTTFLKISYHVTSDFFFLVNTYIYTLKKVLNLKGTTYISIFIATLKLTFERITPILPTDIEIFSTKQYTFLDSSSRINR